MGMTFDEAMDYFDGKVEEACMLAGHKKCRVSYSVYEEDPEAEDEYIDNLNNISVQGKVIFYAAPDDFFGGEQSRSYHSEVIENPTWLQVAVLANAMIRRTRDTHHCFLEGVEVALSHNIRDVPPGVQVYEFIMGS